MTRRTAILFALGTPAVLAAAPPKEFWNEKNPADWTPEEIKELLHKSPWAREAAVTFNSGPGGAGRSNRTIPYGAGSQTGAANQGIEHQQYDAIVRWETALPIRQASHDRVKDDLRENYILSVSGDLPMLGRNKDEDDTQREQRAEMLREFTHLERRRDRIYLSKVVYQPTAETWFYFPRIEPISPSDQQVTFVTKLGPLELKAKFPLKEMLYRNKLEL